jgi:hypothetical protein
MEVRAMKTNYRTILAGAAITSILSMGCVAILSSDDRHHRDEDCSDCHYTVDVYGKQVADTSGSIATVDQRQ